MPLDPRYRGTLEAVIDRMVRDTPKFVSAFRIGRQDWQLTNEDEFFFGLMSGAAVGGFLVAFHIASGRELTAEEASEVMQVLHRRSREIRDAIFRSG